MNHVLDSFPVLNNYLKEKVNFKITKQNLYYHNEKKVEQKLSLTPTNETEKVTILDDEYGQWNPLENDLYYHMQIQLENKNILFDNDIGIASKDLIFRPVQLHAAADLSAVLGLCLHYCGGSFCRFIP